MRLLVDSNIEKSRSTSSPLLLACWFFTATSIIFAVANSIWIESLVDCHDGAGTGIGAISVDTCGVNQDALAAVSTHSEQQWAQQNIKDTFEGQKKLSC
ncbi:hypothetical protein BpHYR1_004375 [Brachionus plicatilis]|uniref:Uncharacterized protein n=1 Tax=Brachionus plicatilis TaxID=10195 RepID=A0A3M7Q5Q2_BRAPC|nr:hypothetical protein BpHYR1_004375 [Brachionus plicatilis]